MSAESYWIERHALATGRAKQAEQDREAAIERAERVELLVRSVYLFGTGFLWKRPDGTEHVLDPAEVSVFIGEDQQSEREQLTARAERAEAAIAAVRALAERWCAMDPLGRIFFDDAADALLAALDSTETVEAAPKEPA